MKGFEKKMENDAHSRENSSDLIATSWQADIDSRTDLYQFFGLPNNDGSLISELVNIRAETASNYGLDVEVYERYRERIERWKAIKKCLENFDERLKTIIKAERRILPLIPLWPEDIDWVAEKKPLPLLPFIKRTVKVPLLSIEQLPCPLIRLASKIVESYSTSSVKLTCEIRKWWDSEALVNAKEEDYVTRGYHFSSDPSYVIVARIEFVR